MSNDVIKTDGQLDAYCKDMAQDIYDETMRDLEGEDPQDHRDDMQDCVHEWVDGDQNVIYYHRAHSICQNCDIGEGEAFLEDVGMPTEIAYDSLAVAIAFGEMRSRVAIALDEIINEWEGDE
tara:strand:+ start:423 stop:788 length:366 start_codon:yes stop_codon:yes gene_type:complete